MLKMKKPNTYTDRQIDFYLIRVAIEHEKYKMFDWLEQFTGESNILLFNFLQVTTVSTFCVFVENEVILLKSI